MREALEALDTLHLNFSKEGLFILNITLAFIMFGVALEIKVEHFKNIANNPKSTIIGFFSQFLALPFVTFILIVLLGKFITPTIAMGMILVASCPGGNISNFMSSLAKANVALEIGGMAFIAAWWGIWHILSGLTISSVWSRIPIERQGNLLDLLKKKN